MNGCMVKACISNSILGAISLLSLSLPGLCQEIKDGGMNFRSTNRDNLRMSNSSTSVIREGGSAQVTGGSINVGSASSAIISELNTVRNVDGVTGELFIAGDRRLWAPTLLIQRTAQSGDVEVPSKTISKGQLNPELIQRLMSGDQLTEEIKKENQGKQYRNTQLTSDYDQLNSLILAKDQQGNQATRGVHVISTTKQGESNTSSINIKEIFDKAQLPETNPSLKTWQSHEGSAKVLEAKVSYLGETKSSVDDNVVNLMGTEGSGTAQSHSQYTVVGFSTNPNPNAGKQSSLSAFSSNTQSVGTLRANENETIKDIAAKYGTTEEVIAKINNLPSNQTDIAGVNLVVPADLSTVGEYQAQKDDTANSIAKRYGISVGWLMDLNGLTDPEQKIADGKRLKVPGLRPLGSDVLPDAKPFTPELENVDYGAYTSYEVTYTVQGSIAPIFAQNILNTFR